MQLPILERVNGMDVPIIGTLFKNKVPIPPWSPVGVAVGWFEVMVPGQPLPRSPSARRDDGVAGEVGAAGESGAARVGGAAREGGAAGRGG